MKQAQSVADAFRQDERVAEARRLLLAALDDYRARIRGPKTPDPDLRVAYAELMQEAGALRGRPLSFPYIGSGIGNGPLVELCDGSVKYDFISGIGVHVLGHSHPAAFEAGFDAALGDIIMQGHLQQNREPVELSRMLVDTACASGAGLRHCFLSTSGAMANENALKIAFQNKSPADRVLAFEGCFMGRTLALAQVTDKPAYREGLPAVCHVDYVPYYDGARPEESAREAVEALREHLLRHPGGHAVMVFELIQGERGSYPGTTTFFKALMDLLREHEVLIFVDEIQTFGRTTEPFAFQHFGLDEYVDMVTIGKMTQVCATLFTPAVNPRPGLLSQTFIGSASALLGARAVVNELTHGGYFGPEGKIAALGAHFVEGLQRMEKRLPDCVRGPYGMGAMIAFTPYDGRPDRVKRFAGALFDAGVIAFVAGGAPARLRFLMPYASIRPADIDHVAELIEQTLIRERTPA